MRLLLVCSTGGHLTQLMALEPWWGGHDRRWVTFDNPHSRSALDGESVIHGHAPTTRNIPNLMRNNRLARRVLADYRPDIIMSTGAGLAVPFFRLARSCNARTSFLEVIDRVESPTMTGRMVYPMTDEFFVQWEEQKHFYPDAQVVGPVL